MSTAQPSLWLKELGDHADLPAWGPLRHLDHRDKIFLTNLFGCYVGDPDRIRKSAAAAGLTTRAEFLERYIRQPKIQAAIGAFLEVALGPAELLKRLEEWVNADIADVFTLADIKDAAGKPTGEKGLTIDPEHLLTSGISRSIKELRFDKDGRPIVKMYDALEAAKILMTFHGMLVKRSVTQKVVARVNLDDAKSRLLEIAAEEGAGAMDSRPDGS